MAQVTREMRTVVGHFRKLHQMLSAAHAEAAKLEDAAKVLEATEFRDLGITWEGISELVDAVDAAYRRAYRRR